MMGQKIFPAAIAFLWLLTACTGVRKVSGTLTKSDEKNNSRYAGHGDYLNRPDTASAPPVRYKPLLAEESKEDSKHAGSSDTYRRDYARISETTAPGITESSKEGGSERLLVLQYQEMDRLADVVLYEISVVEKRWDMLIEQYKNASVPEREQISRELESLDTRKLSLYKAYVKIYKEGKNDWPATKKQVEEILLVLRGVK
ncbi:hypothetical protein DYBT9275_01390 [Dyadobacter sp. CECT 9275]|uniref:Lipoprotein n=1 Tax=Dyadobacter helix TaxID=2822344 RepID=A0A916J9A2_9BACT|nr:hypothetical protein [Dyadobacter sp. CECT 9275]CAG4994430.1 hypothetical protein DYBT9275_01390 [Dyadobacter sp. CECT 9275]